MNTPTPVVYIITKLELGGAQKVCLTLFNEIKNHAQSPTYLISGAEGPLVEQVKDLPNVFLIDSFKRELGIRGIINEFRSFGAIIKILKNLRKQHPDLIVHTHSSKAGIVGRWAAYIAGVKKRVHTVHNFAFHRHQNIIYSGIAYLLELITAPITSHFICVSSANMRTGARFLPAFKRKYRMIRAAVDTNKFQLTTTTRPLPDHKQPFIFGTISCFRPLKNLLELLQAFAEVYAKNSHVRLEILGDGILRPQLEKFIAQNNLQQVVTLHGWQHDVVPFMRTWNCFVLSSLWEGLPCSIIEARLLKLPVLCYSTGGIRDVVHHGINGFVYPQKAWKQLAAGMLAISTDELLYMTLSLYRDNLQEYENSVMVKKHYELYRNL